MLTRALRCLIELRIDDALAIVAQFEDEIARADGPTVPSRDITEVLRAAVAELRSSIHDATPQDSTSRLTESLSPRELSILHSMSRGLSNKRIAQELQIAPETVKSHVKRIFIKLEVQSRAHAVSTASALGML